MAKKIKKKLKLIIAAGKAVPAPPLGPTLSSAGVNIKEFCDKFNEQTRDKMGMSIPVYLTVFEDKTFTMELRTPPMSDLIKKKIGLQKGSARPNLQKVGKLTKQQVREIAEEKLSDLNTTNVDAAMNIVAGTARQMGINIVD